MPKQKTCVKCGESYIVSKKNKMDFYVCPVCRAAKRKGLPAATDKPKEKSKNMKNPKSLYHRCQYSRELRRN